MINISTEVIKKIGNKNGCNKIMGELIRQSEQRARKTYDCMACEVLRNYSEPDLLTPEELFHYEEARQNNFKILPGDKYIRQFCKEDDFIYEFIVIPEIHKICCKYDLYAY